MVDRTVTDNDTLSQVYTENANTQDLKFNKRAQYFILAYRANNQLFKGKIHEIRELCVAGQTLTSLIGIACFTWKYTYETNTESRNKLIKLIVIGCISLYLKRVCQYIIRRILQ